jgi:hypothetical protein
MSKTLILFKIRTFSQVPESFLGLTHMPLLSTYDPGMKRVLSNWVPGHGHQWSNRNSGEVLPGLGREAVGEGARGHLGSI